MSHSSFRVGVVCVVVCSLPPENLSRHFLFCKTNSSIRGRDELRPMMGTERPHEERNSVSSFLKLPFFSPKHKTKQNKITASATMADSFRADTVRVEPHALQSRVRKSPSLCRSPARNNCSNSPRRPSVELTSARNTCTYNTAPDTATSSIHRK